MRLLDVNAMLCRERDIQRAGPNDEVLKELDHKSATYAILSHRWGAEVSYEEVTDLMKMDEGGRDEVRHRSGYKKIIKSCEQAMKDGHELLWIDTCCINKQSSAELSEAINSMYQWYRDAQVCYAYLHDVDETAFPTRPDHSRFIASNGWPEWFLRGWTLQELIAPREVQFFNKDWVSIGDKSGLAPRLERITQIPYGVLQNGLESSSPSVAQIMSWAADRQTTRVEDRAYSLLGLFGVSMPMLYGEGEKAFRRLQLEIIRESNDYSIFAWNPTVKAPRYGSVLADDPSYFGACHNIQKVESDTFVDHLIKYIYKNELGNLGDESKLRKAAQQLSVFVATNAGIQICLPVIPYPESPCVTHCPDSSPVFKAILACSDNYANLITLDLASRGPSFDRTFSSGEVAKTPPEFKALYLTHHQTADPWHCGLTLIDTNVSHHGFVRCGSFPRGTTGNAITLSSRADLIVIIYVNYSTKSRFAVGLGKHSGREWVHVICDEQNDHKPWLSFAEKAYDAMWSASAQHIMSMPNSPSEDFIKHAHLPRSVWAATVVWGKSGRYNSNVTVDIKQCPGCCVAPHRWMISSAHQCDPDGTSRQLWQGGTACMERRKQFEDIRRHFYTILDMHQPVGTETVHSHGVADEAIKFFSDMFALEYLKNYVGEITFFKKLPFIVGTESASESSGVAEDGLQSSPSKLLRGALVTMRKFKRRSITIQDPHLEVVLPHIRKECQTLGLWYLKAIPHLTKKQKMENEMRSISQTLGAFILHHIGKAFTCGHSCIDYDGQLDAVSVLEEINTLRMKLETTEDEAEQRALEEDIAGMILEFCWHAICLEVHKLLSEVLDYIRRTGEVYGLLKFGQLIERTLCPDLDGGQAYLRRIMADARAGISKHQLWLVETTTPHTDLRDPTISPDKPTRDTEGTNTAQGSSASVVS